MLNHGGRVYAGGGVLNSGTSGSGAGGVVVILVAPVAELFRSPSTAIV